MERSLLRQALYEAADLPDRDGAAGLPARGRAGRYLGPRRGGGRLHRADTGCASTTSTSSAFTARPCCTGPSAEVDGADRRRAGARQGDPYPRDVRFPRRRRRGRRAGRAVRAGLSPRAGPVAGARGADRRGQYRRRRQHHLYRRRHPDRLRYRAGQRAARRLHVPLAEPALRSPRAARPRKARSMRPGSRARCRCRSFRCRRRNRSTATISPG